MPTCLDPIFFLPFVLPTSVLPSPEREMSLFPFGPLYVSQKTPSRGFLSLTLALGPLLWSTPVLSLNAGEQSGQPGSLQQIGFLWELFCFSSALGGLASERAPL